MKALWGVVALALTVQTVLVLLIVQNGLQAFAEGIAS